MSKNCLCQFCAKMSHRFTAKIFAKILSKTLEYSFRYLAIFANLFGYIYVALPVSILKEYKCCKGCAYGMVV